MKLHGGSVRVESTVGGGSIFSVTIPLGAAHLPADRVGTPRRLSSTAVGAGAFVEEALRWLPDEETCRAFPGTVGNAREAFPPGASASRPPGARAPDEVVAKRPRILWADDNADMRQYVRRLLGERYDVEAVPDGEAALEAARARPPDLVLSDVMMPRLDGFGLLNALRADPATRAIPVILLSARAGEESRVEGLEAGADDYLVKPFSARELLARVGANLEMARVRREAGERVTHLMESIPDGLITLDREWRYTFVNTPAERLLGRPRSDLLGKCVWDEYPSGVGTEVERQLRRAAADRVMCEFEGQDAGRRRWFENRAFPMPEGGVAIYFRDITERRQRRGSLTPERGAVPAVLRPGADRHGDHFADQGLSGGQRRDLSDLRLHARRIPAEDVGRDDPPGRPGRRRRPVRPGHGRGGRRLHDGQAVDPQGRPDHRHHHLGEVRAAQGRVGRLLRGAAPGRHREEAGRGGPAAERGASWPRPSRSPTSAVGAGTSRATRSSGRTSITASSACRRRRSR